MPRLRAFSRIATSVGSPTAPLSVSSASQQLAPASTTARSSPHTSRTLITPFVSVPVLSVQMTVALPSASTDGSLRTSTCCAAMRCTPMASAMVTTAGNPSGTAATASEMDDVNSSSHGVPRKKPSSATSATMPRHSHMSERPTFSSCACSGVCCSVAVASRWAIFPSSVAGPVASTSAAPEPLATAVPMKT